MQLCREHSIPRRHKERGGFQVWEQIWEMIMIIIMIFKTNKVAKCPKLILVEGKMPWVAEKGLLIFNLLVSAVIDWLIDFRGHPTQKWILWTRLYFIQVSLRKTSFSMLAQRFSKGLGAGQHHVVNTGSLDNPVTCSVFWQFFGLGVVLLTCWWVWLGIKSRLWLAWSYWAGAHNHSSATAPGWPTGLN